MQELKTVIIIVEADYLDHNPEGVPLLLLLYRNLAQFDWPLSGDDKLPTALRSPATQQHEGKNSATYQYSNQYNNLSK
jgi:hypothetical protein